MGCRNRAGPSSRGFPGPTSPVDFPSAVPAAPQAALKSRIAVQGWGPGAKSLETRARACGSAMSVANPERFGLAG